MVESDHELDARLDRLGALIRRGQALAHPLTAKELAVIRAAVHQQWQQEHGQEQPAPTPPPPPTQVQQPEHGKDRGQDHGQDHGQSH